MRKRSAKSEQFFPARQIISGATEIAAIPPVLVGMVARPDGLRDAGTGSVPKLKRV
jgi:hypothetical protein